MYPIDCYGVENIDNIEAVRYYIYLNKEFLKETSKEEYEVFAEFVKGEGKDIMSKIKEVKSQRELTILFNKLERALPYGTSLAKVKGFEGKIRHLHKCLAKLYLKGEEKDNKQILKDQRKIANAYDSLIEDIDAYKDAVAGLRELKEKLKDQTVISQIFTSKLAGSGEQDIVETIKNAYEQKAKDVKEKRTVAFGSLKEYSVKEQIHLLEHENNFVK